MSHKLFLTCILTWFLTIQVIYTLFTRAAHVKVSNALFTTYVQPVLVQGLAFTQHSLGPAEKLTFSLTQVLLMTMILVLVVELGRLRSAMTAARRWRWSSLKCRLEVDEFSQALIVAFFSVSEFISKLLSLSTISFSFKLCCYLHCSNEEKTNKSPFLKPQFLNP